MRDGGPARVLVALVLATGAYSCAAMSADIDIRGVNFKQGLPREGERLVDAVVEPARDSMSILEQDVQVLKAFPKLRVKIVGFTDDLECQGGECAKLSLRRAKYVRDWLLAQGISNRQIDGAEGHGSAEAVDDNANEHGRAHNRRAEMQAITFPDGKPFPSF